MDRLGCRCRAISLGCAALFSIALSAVQVSAQEVSLNKIAAYGTIDYSVKEISAFAFECFDTYNDYVYSDIFALDGYRYMDDLSSGVFAADVSLPSGVMIDYIGFNYCDSNPEAGADWKVILTDLSGDHVTTEVTNMTFPTRSGCGYAYNVSPLNYQYDTNSGHHLVLYVDQRNDTFYDGSMQFRGVEIWYKRKISPAPVAATFSDVPTSHPFFQYIEALYSSGITTGYPDGTFRPDDTVTRKQMAAFLARALGLHWEE